MNNPEPNYKGPLEWPAKAIDVLDHGFVVLRNIAGPTRRISTFEPDNPIRRFDADDVDPAQAARMSFNEMDSDRTYEEDMRLNDYLIRNKHTSPFEMIQIWIEVQVPIFVDRQLVRHRTWRRNESSGRYIVLPDTWYVPEVVGGKPINAKQGQDDTLESGVQDLFKADLDMTCADSYRKYLQYIEMGVAAEHARMFLHLNHYVHWIGNVDLANMFHFLSLRAHRHAQIEAQKYAWSIIDLLREPLPGLMQLFDKHCRRE